MYDQWEVLDVVTYWLLGNKEMEQLTTSAALEGSDISLWLTLLMWSQVIKITI